MILFMTTKCWFRRFIGGFVLARYRARLAIFQKLRQSPFTAVLSTDLEFSVLL